MSDAGISIGIDAGRNRSGGAIAHLVEVLSSLDVARHGIREVHVWAYQALLDRIPDRPWLRKHAPPLLERSLLHQLWWQARHLGRELERHGCDILYTTGASTVCRWKPTVVFSQDLLSYEPGVLRDLGFGRAALRVLAIRYLQNRAFRRADGVVFLTRHAGTCVQASCGPLSRVTHIPHGVSDAFRRPDTLVPWPSDGTQAIRSVYVSPIHGYKHQWHAVRAVWLLRQRGHDVTLTLVGSGDRSSEARLAREIASLDPRGEFVTRTGWVAHAELPALLATHHLFLFASTSESFGITLVEGMAMGMPIVCSDRSSLPETLEDGGVYCNPVDPESMAGAIARVIDDSALRRRIAHRAEALSRDYTWQRCADDTFAYIAEVACASRGSAA